MNPGESGSRLRVFVAVGPAAADPLALAAAAQLAQAAGAELTALFVEDTNLLRLAELPFAMEIGATFAAPRRLTTFDVERAFKNQADELRRALAEISSTLKLELSFDVVRGRPARVLLEAAGETDLIVLASAAVRSLTHAASASIVRSVLHAASSGAKLRRPQPVAAVIRSGPAGLRALAAARSLAQASAADLVLFITGHGAEGAELSAEVAAWLEERGATARVVQLPDAAPDRVAEIVASENLRALFWPGNGELEVAAAVLLESINCPLIVVR